MSRPNPLYGDENERHHQQVQEEPVETDADFRSDVPQWRACASEQHRYQPKSTSGQAQDLAFTQDRRNEAEHESSGDRCLDNYANDVYRINRASLGKRQEPGEMQGEDAAKTEHSKEYGCRPADPAGTHVRRLRIPKQFLKKFVRHFQSLRNNQLVNISHRPEVASNE